MSEQQTDEHSLWIGRCAGCGSDWEVEDRLLIEQYPEFAAVADEIREDGGFEVDCPKCGERIVLEQMTVKMVPFTDWMILPPEQGLCQICAHAHEPELPHNRDSMHYQYWFRQSEQRAGREPRWPTWTDAMAHCTPEVKAGWTRALAVQGVVLDDDA